MSGTSDNALWMQKPELAMAQRRRRMGEQLMQQGGDTSPIQSPWQGLARLAQGLIGGYQQGQADQDISAADAARKERLAAILRDGAPMPAMAPEAPPQQPMTAPQQPVQRQFLPPAGVDPEEDYLVRTVYGEARGEPAQGQQAVAHVIRNRARVAGMPIRDVVMAPGQFEPWGNPQTRAQLEGLDPASPEYQAILKTIREGAQDPTGGATHFYSPTAQAAAGRPTPAWAQGQGQDIGRHRFYNLPYSAPRGGVPQATGDTIPAQGPEQPPGQAPAPRTPDGQQFWLEQSQRLQRQARAMQEEGEHGTAAIIMQQAAIAHQTAMARAPQPSEFDALAAAAGLQRGSPEYQQFARQRLERLGAPPTTTVNNNPENYAARKAIEDWGVAKTAASDTARRTTLFDTAISVLDSKAFAPGATAELRLKAAQLGEALGLETNAPAGEVLKAVGRQLELANTPKGQGQITENERVLIREMLPVLGATEEGLRMLIEATKLLDARDQQVFRIYNDSARKNGGVPNLADVNEALADLPPALPPQMTQRFSQWKEVNPTSGPGGASRPPLSSFGR